MDLGLAGRTALVTGSHRGTGREIARGLAREGAEVVVHGFEDAAAEAVAEAIHEAGGRARHAVGELTSDAGARAIREQAGPIDVLVASYGVAEGGSWESPTADWVDQYEKNVLSAVRMIHAFVPDMRERGFGRVILLGTIGSTRPAARMPHYYAAKSALPSVCLSLAKELAGTGVTVNLVSPGILATDEVRAGLIERARRKGRSTDWADVERDAASDWMPNLVGRLGRPEEVADLVAFLASDRAGFLTGTQWRVDGGASDVAL
jgi:NAD(P)-dependent dehydrogenase (short-subunit alcohol dehydrogenase family)